MADKKRKTQAQKAASASSSKKGTSGKQDPNKLKKDNKRQEKTSPVERNFPVRFVTSCIFLAAFVFMLVIYLRPEGAITKLIADFLFGLLGRVGFLVTIPALLYLFFIHAFSANRPIIMRSICLGSFILSCGSIAHLSLDPQYLSSGFALLGDLYAGGINATTGGLLCGGLAMLLQLLFGKILSFILLTLSAILTLLGAMQITVPSIIRAVKNRPRAEWENEPIDQPEPASIVVNHIATKRIEYVENRRNKVSAETAEVASSTNSLKKSKPLNSEEKMAEMIRQIDFDVDAAEAPGVAVKELTEEELTVPSFVEAKKEAVPAPQPENKIQVPDVVQEEPIPSQMPKFEKDAPLQNGPKVVKPKKVTVKDTADIVHSVEKDIEENLQKPLAKYTYPPIDLLKLSSASVSDGTAEMRENTRRLNETLASFKIEAHIINVTRGPSVTRYEVELDKGVRLNKITTAADDIALNLGAAGVRIAAIPGKISVVGIEVPNRSVTTVSLREVIDSPEFIKSKSKSSFAVGKDIGGSCIIGNISKLPHMLIAGTTGSGKSVCMNSIIISLLYKASPEDVKLIMIDPKMVELGIYNSIPHLLIPVVTDPKKAAGSLQWAVTEMMRRYKAMSDAGVRDLESYNSIIEHEENTEKLPQIVVIIDELADLMLVAAKEVEESICRIAQMGRAAGMHLVIATQRPSADVITGLMKANIPSRIAFAVASAMESRIILDTQGAEKLVGKGDMLFAPIGCGKPKRVQGCFVTDSEVEAVANYVKEHYTTSYDQQVMEEIERKAAQTGSKQPTASDPEPSNDELDGDEMLPAAVDVILETGQASVSMLQRRLKLGYARAARIVDEMEEKGIVGPFQGSKPRVILVTKEQWEVMRSGGASQMDFDDLVEEYDSFSDPEE